MTYGDDGEKFGVWPDTHDWVWGRGWLRQFFEQLEDPDQGVELILPSEQIDRFGATDRVYLPTASYHEMGEWTLNAEAGRKLLDLKKALASHDLAEQAEPFLHGGIWMGFLAKYPEANVLHKRMLRVSAKVAHAEAHLRAGEVAPQAEATQTEGTIGRARRALYRGQCNCPYWHGLFGGLYLPHLRHAVYRQLVEAGALADEAVHGVDGARLELRDLDGDLRDEVALEAEGLVAWVDPEDGGQLLVLDDRRRRVSLGHVLTRRPETYHRDLLAAAEASEKGDGGGDADGPKSIHDTHRSKVPDLKRRLVYDDHARRILVDHLLPAGVDLSQVDGPDVAPLADLVNVRYEVTGRGGHGEPAAWVELTGKAPLAGSIAGVVQMTKRITLTAPSTLEVAYGLTFEPDDDDAPPIDALFTVESSLALVPGPESLFHITLEEPAADGPPWRSPQERGTVASMARAAIGSSLGEVTVGMKATPPTGLVWFPLETVSQSEDGAELVYQGTVLTAAWPLSLAPGREETRTLTVEMR